MKRYEHYGSLDGGGPAEPIEESDGEWVRYEDAIAAVAEERERCMQRCRGELLACPTDSEGDQAYDRAVRDCIAAIQRA